jgi:hypothetical protein
MAANSALQRGLKLMSDADSHSVTYCYVYPGERPCCLLFLLCRASSAGVAFLSIPGSSGIRMAVERRRAVLCCSVKDPNLTLLFAQPGAAANASYCDALQSISWSCG